MSATKSPKLKRFGSAAPKERDIEDFKLPTLKKR
jgi:hypothetical protein